MTPAMWVTGVVALGILTGLLGWWTWEHLGKGRRARPAEFSSVAAEMAAMQAAWRVRDAELAAERYMDEFIAQRQAAQRRDERFVVDGEVIDVRTEPPTWPTG